MELRGRSSSLPPLLGARKGQRKSEQRGYGSLRRGLSYPVEKLWGRNAGGRGAWGTRMVGEAVSDLIRGVPTSLSFVYLLRSFMFNSRGSGINQAHS